MTKTTLFELALVIVTPLLLTVGAAPAQQVVTIPCSHVDEFVKGAIEVPPGAEVRVTGLTLSTAIQNLGADRVARLLSTDAGRQALKVRAPAHRERPDRSNVNAQIGAT